MYAIFFCLLLSLLISPKLVYADEPEGSSTNKKGHVSLYAHMAIHDWGRVSFHDPINEEKLESFCGDLPFFAVYRKPTKTTPTYAVAHGTSAEHPYHIEFEHVILPNHGEVPVIAVHTLFNKNPESKCSFEIKAKRPQTTKPQTTKPQTTKSQTTKPQTTKSQTTKPQTAKSQTTKPQTAKSQTTKPQTTKSQTTKPQTAKSQTTKPQTTKPQTTKPQTTKPQTTKSQTKSETAPKKIYIKKIIWDDYIPKTKIKEIRTYQSGRLYKQTELDEQGRITYQRFLTHYAQDKRSLQTQRIVYNQTTDEKIQKIYDSMDRMISETVSESTGKQRSRKSIVWNKDGSTVSLYRTGGQPFAKRIYNKIGTLIEQENFNKYGSHRSKTIYKYNERTKSLEKATTINKTKNENDDIYKEVLHYTNQEQLIRISRFNKKGKLISEIDYSK